MKKIVVVFGFMLSMANALAAGEHQVATSQAYVTEELATKQDKFNKLGADTAMTYSGTTDGAVSPRTISDNLGAETNTSDTAIPTVGAVNTKLANQQDTLNLPADTVLMNTGVAGTPTAKGIYDDSGDYNTQTDSLIDAATLNAAVQTAVNSEFVCVERKIPGDDTSPCYLFEIVTTTPNLIIPAEYTRLEYLESTGTQYIDSGVGGKPGTVVKAKFRIIGTPPSNKDTGFLGCWGDSYASYYLYLHTFAGLDICFWFTNTSKLLFNMDHDDHTIEYETNGSYYFDGIYHKVNVYANSIDGTNIGIFRAIGRAYVMSSVASRFYYVQLDNGTTSRNFIPAKRNSDGVLGMYDTVSGTFFTNAGSGTFIAGPELSSNIYLPMN